MNYNKTTKPKLIEMLKNAQAENVRLAGKADNAEKIATATMSNNAKLREEVDDLDGDRKLIESSYKARYEKAERLLAERDERVAELEKQNEYRAKRAACAEQSLKESTSKIAELEKQIAGAGKVDGVFEVGDRVVGKVSKVGGVVKSVHLDRIEVAYDDGDYLREGARHYRHANATPPCPNCKAKDAEIAKLRGQREDYKEENERLEAERDELLGIAEQNTNLINNAADLIYSRFHDGTMSDLYTMVEQLICHTEEKQDAIDKCIACIKINRPRIEKNNIVGMVRELVHSDTRQLENQQSTIESLQSDFDAMVATNLHLRDAVIRGQVEVSKVRSGEL